MEPRHPPLKRWAMVDRPHGTFWNDVEVSSAERNVGLAM
jgi:hypothetical protein